MIPHILSVQDLSCVGRCSLTVALPVLSAMGVRCSVLPTAVLSTHTGFPSPEVVSLTDSLSAFSHHWLENGITFDAISVGYLSDPRQAEQILRIQEQFSCPLLLDPVMGDSGKLYSRITPEHITAMEQLCAHAQVVIPNVTEACALTELVYTQRPEPEQLGYMADRLRQSGAKNVLITGVSQSEDTLGFYGADEAGTPVVYQAPRIPRHFHGTGDLFAAVLAGAYLQGRTLQESGILAADFVRRCVAHTPVSTPHGVEFEPLLCSLSESFCQR